MWLCFVDSGCCTFPGHLLVLLVDYAALQLWSLGSSPAGMQVLLVPQSF